MTVGFDVTWMDKENQAGGVFQYAFRLISALVEHTDTNVVAIIGPTGEGIFDGLKGHTNFREVHLRPSGSLLDVIEIEKIDIIHTPVQHFPNVTFSAPMISTLHDLQHYYYPEFFTEDVLNFRNIYYRGSAQFAERVIVSFQHVKEDIVKFYGIPAEKIDVCPLGFITPEPAEDNTSVEIKKKYDVPERYIFYSANTWRHKNHISLIKALKILHDKHGIKVSLVCTGQKYPDFFPEIESEINNLGLGTFIHFVGYIPEQDVRLLLKNAALAVIPTLYEAGSFPLMEAMAFEVPVICSNVTSLPDTIGDERFVFDPKDVEHIADKVAIILRDEKLMEENRTNSRTRVKDWSWDNVVHNFVKTYSKAIEEFRNKNEVSVLKTRMQFYEFLTNENLRKQKEVFQSLQNSYSWKITAPMRAVARFLKRQ